MASRTVYTSTVTTPIYAGWKCQDCGEINFSVGTTVCTRKEYTSVLGPQIEAKERAEERAKEEWARDAYEIIINPERCRVAMGKELVISNANCTKCGKKPKWYRSGALAKMSPSSIVFAIICPVLVAFNIAIYILEARYNSRVKKLPKEYLPVLGSDNLELLVYARSKGKSIPDKTECLAIAKGTLQWDYKNSETKRTKLVDSWIAAQPSTQAARVSVSTPSGWTCSCGRGHAAYESSCVCGKNKWEAAKKPDNKNT